MKKGFVCIMVLFLLSGLKVNAQLKRGNILLGADLSDVNLGLDKGGNFSFLINPKAAWFIRENVAIGAYLLTGLRTAKYQGTDVNYGVGGVARYYINSKKVSPSRNSCFFLEGHAGIEGNNPSVGDNTNGLGFGVGPGWVYFITPSIGLETLLKYNGIVGFGTNPTSNNLNLSVGFQIYLPAGRGRAVEEDIKNSTR